MKMVSLLATMATLATIAPFSAVIAPVVLSGDKSAGYVDQIIVADRGVMGLCYGSDGKVYYADYFNHTVGTLDVATGRMTDLIRNLKNPSAIAAFGDKIVFTESGTEQARFKDGTVSILNPISLRCDPLAADLEYPVSVCVDSVKSIYVLEAAGTSTSFGGRNRLIRFPSTAKPYETVLDNVGDGKAVVIDRRGGIYIGTMGGSSPGDRASIVHYSAKSGRKLRTVEGLPTIQDMVMDSQGNIYVAGFGLDEGRRSGVCLVPLGFREFVDLKLGCQANCLALDGKGGILYSTGRSAQSICLLSKKP